MGLRSVIKHELVRVADTPAPRPNTGARPAACAAAPTARVLELEGRAHAIEVTCGCGRAMVVELEYADRKGETQ